MNKFTTILLILLFSFSVLSQTLLTNESVVEMVKASIEDAVIIAKIKASDVKFDTSTDGLKTLKENNVSSAVQTAMIEKSVIPKTEMPVVQSAAAREVSVPSPSFTPYSLLSKSDQKERLKQPAQISIAAPKDKVSAIVIQTFQNLGFVMQNDSPSRLILQKKLSGANAFLGQLALGSNGGSPPMANYAFTLFTVGAITTVSVDISMVSENVFGKSNRLNLNKNKKNREEMDNILVSIKSQSEL